MASGTIKELSNSVTAIEVSSDYCIAKIRFIRSGNVKQVIFDGFKDLVNQTTNNILTDGNFPADFKPSISGINANITLSGPECYRITISKTSGIVVYPYDGIAHQANVAQAITYI